MSHTNDIQEVVSPPRIRPVLRPSLVVGVIYLLLITFFLLHLNYNLLDFAHLGTIWSENDPAGRWGYDGQFFYQIARQPDNAWQFMDHVPYRYQRILYPIAARLLAAGNQAWVPFTLLFLNWLSIVGGVEIVSRLLQRHQFSPWYSLAYGLYFGLATALTFDTAEPFTYLLVCIAIWLYDRQHNLLSALLLGLAALSRETAVLFTFGFVLYFLFKKNWKDSLGYLLLGLAPLAAWYVALSQLFGKSGLGLTLPLEPLPFYGVLQQSPGFGKFSLLIILIVIPTLASLILAGVDLFQRKLNPLLLAWIFNLILVTFLSRYIYVDLVSCSRIAIGAVLAGVAYGIIARRKIVLDISLYNVFAFQVYLIGVWYGVKSLLL